MMIERAHRVGKKRSSGKPRPIVKFSSSKDCGKVLKSRRLLKGTGISIREDFSDKIANKKRKLIPQMLKEGKNGKVAYLRYDKLIVHDKRPELEQPTPFHNYQSVPGPYP